MDDVAALCPRVIVIDKGRLIYDGPLAELVHRIRPDKRLQLRLGAEVDRAALSALGTVISHQGIQATLQIPQARLQDSISRALAQLPIIDLTLEDPPLEEVMAELFARSPAPAA
jgi:ABC-2 type transport system ATP-binding protein